MLISEDTSAKSEIHSMRTIDVLVIDDEESMREACRQTLETEGWSAAVAENGAKGLEILSELGSSVVLLDLKMPGMSGMEVLTEIPKIDTSAVIIIITGYGTIDTAVEAMKTGAFDFLTKPFDPELLIETVRRGLKLRQSLKKEKTEEIASTEVPESVEGVQLSKHNILLKGLEALGEYYSLGIEERDFFQELKYLEAEAKYHAVSYGQIKKMEKEIRNITQGLRKVEAIITKYDNKKSALLQILLDIQREFNWLPRHILKWVSTRLNIPPANIHTIINFYEAFSLEPRGAHLVQVCEGTACHVRGATDLLSNVSSFLGIQSGETDLKRLFTLKKVHCMGCCALGPVIKIDEEYYSNPTPHQMNKIFSSLEE